MNLTSQIVIGSIGIGLGLSVLFLEGQRSQTSSEHLSNYRLALWGTPVCVFLKVLLRQIKCFSFFFEPKTSCSLKFFPLRKNSISTSVVGSPSENTNRAKLQWCFSGLKGWTHKGRLMILQIPLKSQRKLLILHIDCGLPEIPSAFPSFTLNLSIEQLLLFSPFAFWEVVKELLEFSLHFSHTFSEDQLHLCITIHRFSYSSHVVFLLEEQNNWKMRHKGLSLPNDKGL